MWRFGAICGKNYSGSSCRLRNFTCSGSPANGSPPPPSSLESHSSLRHRPQSADSTQRQSSLLTILTVHQPTHLSTKTAPDRNDRRQCRLRHVRAPGKHLATFAMARPLRGPENMQKLERHDRRELHPRPSSYVRTGHRSVA